MWPVLLWSGDGAAVHDAAGERCGAHRDTERLGIQPGSGGVEGSHWPHCWQECRPSHALEKGSLMVWIQSGSQNFFTAGTPGAVIAKRNYKFSR